MYTPTPQTHIGGGSFHTNPLTAQECLPPSRPVHDRYNELEGCLNEEERLLGTLEERLNSVLTPQPPCCKDGDPVKNIPRPLQCSMADGLAKLIDRQQMMSSRLMLIIDRIEC